MRLCILSFFTTFVDGCMHDKGSDSCSCTIMLEPVDVNEAFVVAHRK